tara:strand:- start:1027 stop:1446 length:420 start_codon:yes stop_codon:yes gene_type:complete
MTSKKILKSELITLQNNINMSHDQKLAHINQLKISIEELNAINNTRKIQRSNFTQISMNRYYVFTYLSLLILIGIIVFWVLIGREMKSGNATLDNINVSLVAGVIIIIIFGFLLVNAFWGINVRAQMDKNSYLYKFPQY